MGKKPKPQDTKGVELRGVDLSEVERLLAFMKKHSLEEFEYQQGDVHIRLRKAASAPVAAAWAPVAAPAVPPAEVAGTAPQAAEPLPRRK